MTSGRPHTARANKPRTRPPRRRTIPATMLAGHTTSSAAPGSGSSRCSSGGGSGGHGAPRRAGAAPRAAGTRRAVRSAAGGRGGFGESPLIIGPSGSPMGRNAGAPGGPGQRLIIPGGPSFGAGRGRGGGEQQRRPGPPGGGLGIDGPEPSSGPGQLPPAHKYRPPPGFMNADAQDPAANQADPQEMLNRLRARAGAWHQLARLLPVLYAKGLDSNTIAELSGLNPVDQNAWVVAGTVYDSIAALGKVRRWRRGVLQRRRCCRTGAGRGACSLPDRPAHAAWRPGAAPRASGSDGPAREARRQQCGLTGATGRRLRRATPRH